MSKALNDLSERFRPLAVELIARAVEAGIPLVIIDTRRTVEEQAKKLLEHVSWTKNSKHLTGDAIDLCPFEHFEAHGANKLNWNSADPDWQRLGVIGEALGLTWGGRWQVRDMGHFEIKEPA